MWRGKYINRFDWGSRSQEACQEADLSTNLTGDLELKRHVKRQVYQQIWPGIQISKITLPCHQSNLHQTHFAEIRAALVNEPSVEASALATASLHRWRRSLSVTLQCSNAQTLLACSGTPAAPPIEDVNFILDPHGSLAALLFSCLCALHRNGP